jgi:hypothetical protein
MLSIPETLRKHPPASNITRVVTQPYTIPDTSAELEKGIRVVIPVYAIHHDPCYYPEPERFDPERFSDEAKFSRPHFTYLPFGEGPRNCIGKSRDWGGVSYHFVMKKKYQFITLNFSISKSHFHDTAQIGHLQSNLHAVQCKTQEETKCHFWVL